MLTQAGNSIDMDPSEISNLLWSLQVNSKITSLERKSDLLQKIQF
jgi:hypothetical protein